MIKNSIKHLDFFITHIPISLNYYHDSDVNSVQFFSLGLLKRLLHSSESLKLILQSIELNPHLDFSAGLTIRALILDMLIGLNFLKLLKDNLPKNLPRDEMLELTTLFCNKALADGLENTIKYLELAQTFGFLENSSVKTTYNTLAENFSKFLKPHSGNGTKPELKFGKAYTANELFKNIARDSEMHHISGIYDLYLFYSKYEHFGILYFDVESSPLLEKINRIEKAIRLLINHCANLFDILERSSQKDKFIFTQYKIANDYLLAKKD